MALGFVNGESRFRQLISATLCFTVPTEVVPFSFQFSSLHCSSLFGYSRSNDGSSTLGQHCHCKISCSTMAPQIKHSFFTGIVRKLNAQNEIRIAMTAYNSPIIMIGMALLISNNADRNDTRPNECTLRTMKSSSCPSIVKGFHAIKCLFCEQIPIRYFL